MSIILLKRFRCGAYINLRVNAFSLFGNVLLLLAFGLKISTLSKEDYRYEFKWLRIYESHIFELRIKTLMKVILAVRITDMSLLLTRETIISIFLQGGIIFLVFTLISLAVDL